MKYTRAATFVWKTENGRYLMWYHNHGGFIYYNQRNPAWIAAGHEVDTPEGKAIAWSEPEILLYDEAPSTRISYPDFVEDSGRFFVTETQKSIARVHEIPAEFIELLWDQHRLAEVSRKGMLLEAAQEGMRVATKFDRPEIPDLANPAGEGGGFTMEFWVKFNSLDPRQTLVDARDPNGNGIALFVTDRGTLQVSLRGPFASRGTRPPPTALPVEDFGLTEASWDCDPGLIETGTWHHVAVVVDGGPNLIWFVIDGKLNDGGDRRQFEWGRFPAELKTVDYGDTLSLATRLDGEMKEFRLYGRALRTTEIIGNQRAVAAAGGVR